MRTLIIILVGFALWGGSLAVARLIGGPAALSSWTATVVFAVLWFVLAATNMWTGVSRAGYSFIEELPNFLLPVAVAVVAKWKLI